eukprot:Clim_evm18s252 gene=Clim_evmTU18s252
MELAKISVLAPVFFGLVHGHLNYLPQFPNGALVLNPKDNSAWVAVGHNAPDGTGGLNPFGEDFTRFHALTGSGWSLYLCLSDSDGDGQTNGHELGDPCCEWVENGKPFRMDNISHPGLDNSMTHAPPCAKFSDKALKAQEELKALKPPLIAYTYQWIAFSLVCMTLVSSTIVSRWQPSRISVGILGIWLTVAELVQWFLGLVLLSTYIKIAAGQHLSAAGIVDAISRALADGAILTSSLCFLMMVRRNPVLQVLTWRSFERNIEFHRVLGWTTLVFTSGHAATMIYLHAIDEQGLSYLLSPYRTGIKVAALPGIVAGILLLTLGIISYPTLRRKVFEVFYWMHIVLALVYAGFVVAHIPRAALILAPTMGLYALDRVLRISSREHRMGIKDLRPIGDYHTLLELSPGAKHAPGQYMFLAFPDLKVGEWHPFSICNQSTQANSLRFIIKNMQHDDDEGMPNAPRHDETTLKNEKMKEFTSILYQAAIGKRPQPTEGWVEGPYGALPFNVSNYPSVVLFAGGVGITPMFSLFSGVLTSWSNQEQEGQEGSPQEVSTNEITPLLRNANASQSVCPVRQIQLHWSVRDAPLACFLLDEIQSMLANVPEAAQIEVHVHIYFRGSDEQGFFAQDTVWSGCKISTQRCSVLEVLSSPARETAVAVCGPDSLVADVRKAAACDRRLHIHTETFLF